MENQIGIVHINSGSERNNRSLLLKKALDEQNCLLVEITEVEQIMLLDGLIIDLEEPADYIKVFQWLIDLQEAKPLFVWILCAIKQSELIKLYLHLSKNSVIEIIPYDQEIELLGLIIRNAFNYKNYLLEETKLKKISDDCFLEASKLNLVVYDKSIAFTRKEFKIIELLYTNIEELVTYQELNKEIYGDSMEEPLGKYKIANLVFYIRNKLQEQSYLEIKVIRAKGYVLTFSKK